MFGAEEKKTEKRGVYGLGYGLGAPAPLLGGSIYGGHGLGLYGGHGIGGLGWGHGLAAAPVYGHSIASAPLIGHGLYGHGYSAPLLSGHSLSYGSAPLLSHAPLYGGLGHGIGYGGWH